MKEEKIKIELINKSFKVFNADRIKNGKVTWFALLKVEINRYKEYIDTVVTDLNSMDIFLEYDWLIKHNPEIYWNTGTIWFTRCSKEYRTQHQDILFKNRRIQLMDN